MRKDPSNIIAIVGPTASGKSALAVALARKFGGEIISADSRQIYRGMDIGSGKIMKHGMHGVPHHLLDVASPRRTFTAAQYQKRAARMLKKIIAHGKLPIVAGGTGFYIDALLYGYSLPSVKPDAALRRRLESQSAAALFRQLQKLDPRRAARIERRNPRRLIRALEIVLTTKKPVPGPEILAKQSQYRILKIGLNPGPEQLKRRIAARLRARLKSNAMVAEVERLHAKGGVSWQRLDSFGLEYRFVSRFLRGMITKTQMAAAIQKESWRYARRQMTWFRKDAHIHWIATPAKAPPLVRAFLKKTGKKSGCRGGIRILGTEGVSCRYDGREFISPLPAIEAFPDRLRGAFDGFFPNRLDVYGSGAKHLFRPLATGTADDVRGENHNTVRHLSSL